LFFDFVFGCWYVSVTNFYVLLVVYQCGFVFVFFVFGNLNYKYLTVCFWMFYCFGCCCGCFLVVLSVALFFLLLIILCGFVFGFPEGNFNGAINPSHHLVTLFPTLFYLF